MIRQAVQASSIPVVWNQVRPHLVCSLVCCVSVLSACIFIVCFRLTNSFIKEYYYYYRLLYYTELSNQIRVSFHENFSIS